MIKELVKITARKIGEDAGILTVDARELHAYLEVKKDFSSWIKYRSKSGGFVEGQDFVTLLFDSPKLVNQTGRGGDRRSKEYHLTLDMAKHLAMLQNNQKGHVVRRYFIETEKRHRAGAGLTEEMIDLLIEDRITRDPRIRAVHAQSARQIAEERGPKPRKRGYVQRISNSLSRFCIANNKEWSRDPHSGIKVFQNAVVKIWLYTEQANALLAIKMKSLTDEKGDLPPMLRMIRRPEARP